jgi:hypothetical protein
MSTLPEGCRCPYARVRTGIPRGLPADLPVPLTAAEFETMVRNEWRRRLGPAAYQRSHPWEIIRSLSSLLARKEERVCPRQIGQGLECVSADLKAEGLGCQALLQEITKLRHAIRTVLRHNGADFVTAGEYVSRVREVLDEGLDSIPQA